VLRFWNHDILQNPIGVLEAILLAAGRKEPSPNPLPQAGEGEQPVSRSRLREGPAAKPLEGKDHLP
jgi:hypothetical protein